MWTYEVKHNKSSVASSQKQKPDQRRAWCQQSDVSVLHQMQHLVIYSPLLNVQMRADCPEEAADLLIQMMQGVCEPGHEMCCQRAVTSDLAPKTLTQPSSILFTPSNHMPLCPVHWPDGCLIKERMEIQWADNGHYSRLHLFLHYFVVLTVVFISDPG